MVAVCGVLVATAAVPAGHRAPPRTQAPPEPALFVSPNGLAAGPCSRASPCASWNAAYQRARPGQVIEVAGGTYPGQTIEGRSATRNLSPGCTPADPARCIVFRPAAGASVAVQGNLQVDGSSVWIQGTSSPASPVPTRGRTFSITVSGYVDTEATSEEDFPDHVVVQGIAATSFGVFGVHHALFRDLDIGPATVGAGCNIVEGPGIENKIGIGGGIEVVPTDVTLDGLLIHNQNRNQAGADSDCHFGGLFLATANRLTIERSVFSQDAVYDIQVQNFDGVPPPAHVTIQNNWFGCPTLWLYQAGGEGQCDGQEAIQFNSDAPFADWLIRYNSFVSGIGQYVDGASFSDVRVVGNAGSDPQACFSGMTFAYNAWTGRRCAPTDRRLGDLPFVSSVPGREDLALAQRSAAAALVPPSSGDLRLDSDIAGHRRPSLYPRAAGSLERDTSLLVPGRSIGSVSLGTPAARIAATYGPFRGRSTSRLGARRTSAQVATVAAPGGALRVTEIGGTVVGVATTSPFYSTPGGVGVGAPLAAAARLPHATWVPCVHAMRVRVGGVAVSFLSTAAKRRITGISMIRDALVAPCAKRR